MEPNPILDFGIDKAAIQYVGSDLQRPECILAERDGTLWAADARGGVVKLSPDGRQQVIAQKRSNSFAGRLAKRRATWRAPYRTGSPLPPTATSSFPISGRTGWRS